MQENYAKSLAAVLVHEGGFVNDPKDPGGATNKGITQAVFDDWRHSHGLHSESVKLITDADVASIYKRNYWDACKCDDLPAGVDYCVFDLAVNSGTRRAIRYLQEAVGVAADGKIGPMTLAAIKGMNPVFLVESINLKRQHFLEQLPTFQHFGKGWTARVSEVTLTAKEMANG